MPLRKLSRPDLLAVATFVTVHDSALRITHGPRVPQDRNARARFLWLVRMHRRPGASAAATRRSLRPSAAYGDAATHLPDGWRRTLAQGGARRGSSSSAPTNQTRSAASCGDIALTPFARWIESWLTPTICTALSREPRLRRVSILWRVDAGYIHGSALTRLRAV